MTISMAQILTRILSIVFFTIIILHPIISIHKYGSLFPKHGRNTELL